MELTGDCNFRCRHCGVADDLKHIPLHQIESLEAKFLSEDFVRSLRNDIVHYPLIVGRRNLFYGGGEPLINSQRFTEIHRAFDNIENTTRVVITKGKYFVRIWVSFEKLDPENTKPFEKFLKNCEKPFRHYLAERVGLHTIPELKFILDDSYYYVKRVNELLAK